MDIGKENGDGGSEGKSLVFGIYQRNGKVITFPVSDRKHDTLIPLIKLHTKKGSLYYTDDHTAYASLESNWKTSDNCSSHGRNMYVKILVISMVLKDSGVMQRHGCIIIEEYPNSTFTCTLKK